jgi:gliding motility-associated-like protein
VFTESIGGTYIYSVTSLDNNGCAISQTANAYFVNNPALALSSVSICPLQTGTLNVSGATSYTWSDNTNNNFLSGSPITTTNYTVMGSAFGCISTATAAIIVKPLPLPLIGSNSPLCNGTNLSLFANGGTSYLWSGPQLYTSVNQNPVIVSSGLTNAGVYNVTVTSANSCTSSASATVVVDPTPTVSAAGATVCTSQTLNLNAVSVAGATYSWQGPGGFISSLQNPSVTLLTTNLSGQYTVIAISPAGCTNAAMANALIVPPPSLSVSLSGSGTLCAQALNGSPNTITLTSGGAAAYTLTTPNHVDNPNPNGPVSPLTSIPPYQGNAVTETATLTGSNGICAVTKTVSFSIIPNPTVALTPTVVIIAGETYTYQSSGASSFTWGPNSPGLTTYVGPITVASPTVTSVYSVVGGSLGCNSGTQTSTITVYPLPTLTVTPNEPAICLGKSIQLTVAGTGNAYSWSPPEGLSVASGQIVNASPLLTKKYVVVASANNCTNAAMVTVSVLSLPTPTLIASKNRACVNESVTLKSEGNFPVNYWSTPIGTGYALQSHTFIASSIAYGGTYTLTVTDINGCEGQTTTLLEINELPGGYLMASMPEGCVPYWSDFKFTTPQPSNIIATWQVGNKKFTEKAFSYNFTKPGKIIITGNLADTLTHCVNTVSLTITGNQVPVASYSWFPEKPVEGLDEVLFTNTSTGPDQNKWSWYFIDNNGYTSEEQNPSYQFVNEGTYAVAMVVTTSKGCSDTITKAIKVEPDFAAYIPNAFTPNGDNNNEVFMPVIRSAKKYRLIVFNRWGQTIFSTTDVNAGWDGTFNNERCQDGVYVWRITLSAFNGESKELTGSVSLYR